MFTSRVSICALVSAVCCSTVAMVAEASVTDNFDSTHNYVADGVSGTIWSGVLNSANASVISANSNEPGRLVMTTNGNSTGWDGGAQTGPYLYREVTGDFIATVTVTGGTAANYNVASLLARDPSATTVAEENFLSANYNFFGTTPGVQSRNVVSGSTAKFDTTTIAASVPVALRIERAENLFTASYSADGGDTWVQLTSVTKAMPETIQIGLAAANYGANSYSVSFDDFAVVPEPASISLAVAASLLVLARRRH